MCVCVRVFDQITLAVLVHKSLGWQDIIELPLMPGIQRVEDTGEEGRGL
jgi:hypothetical protein